MPKKIILIDDNSLDNVSHERIIRSTTEQVDISIIDNGREAQVYLNRELRPRNSEEKKIVIIDQYMPHLTGLDILENLDEQLKLDPSSVEIYFLTCDNSVRLREKTAHISAVKGVIRKPLTTESAERILSGSHFPTEGPDPSL